MLTRTAATLALLTLSITIGCAPEARCVLDEVPTTDILAGRQAQRPTQELIRPTRRPSRPIPRPPKENAEAVPAAWKPSGMVRPWRWIVVHHSATDAGSADIFDRAHRARGWDELGYHFVICNGNGGEDGRIQVGSRWTKQKWGAHCKTPDNRYNDYGIGICLVGDTEKSRPTAAQLASLARLTSYLADRYDIPASCVIGHGEAPGTSTNCPGKHLAWYLRAKLRPWLSKKESVAGR
jgi:N-acetyl-anhydromuramyl-L-alanine amidase AmpD